MPLQSGAGGPARPKSCCVSHCTRTRVIRFKHRLCRLLQTLLRRRIASSHHALRDSGGAETWQDVTQDDPCDNRDPV